ncbi:Glycoside hydrolase family 15 carbohydrate-binding module family 21 protein, partial [Globisporangium polare]
MVFAAIRNVLAVLIVAAVCASAAEVKVNSYTYSGSTLSGTVT